MQSKFTTVGRESQPAEVAGQPAVRSGPPSLPMVITEQLSDR